MQKVINLFNQLRFEEFLRLVISDSNLILFHISNNKILDKLSFDFIDKPRVIDFLKGKGSLPLEIIISNNTMSCRSINLNNLREKDLIALANNVLNGKNGGTNLVCYEKKFSYRKGRALFCDMKLSPVISAILYEIVNLGNPIISIVAWPFWLVSSYFKLHPGDRGKFKSPVFIVKTKSSYEVIALCNEKYIYYRKGNIDSFDESVEIDGVIKFINQLSHISPDDIAIYTLTDETIDLFTMNSEINMNLVSKNEDFSNFNKNKNWNLMFKAVCLSVFAGLFVNTIFDVAKIFDYNSEISKARDTVESADSDLIKEIAAWEEVESYLPTDKLNMKSQINSKLKSNTKKLQNANIKIDEKTRHATLNTIYEEGE